MEDAHLTVAGAVATADTDGRDAAGGGECGGHAVARAFDDHGEGSGTGYSLQVCHECLGFSIGLAFHLVASFFPDLLGQQADVRLHRDAGLHDGADFGFLAHAAFQFYGIHPGAHELAGVLHGKFGGVKGADGHVENDEGIFRGASHAFAVVQHVGQGHVGGIRESQHGHAQGIAHQNHIEAGFIHHAGGGVIVSGELGNGFLAHLGRYGGNLFRRCHVGIVNQRG